MAQFHLLTVFEKVLAYYSSTLAIGAEKELVLKLLARASQSGCCTSLVTRLGLLSWLDAELAKHDKYSSALRTLTIRFQEGCQQSQIDNWAGRRLRSQDSRKSRAETPLSVPWATEDDIAMPESVA